MEMTYETMGVPGLSNIKAADYGSTTVTYPESSGSQFYVQALSAQAEMWLKCSCQAELKLTNYAIPAALNYAKEWWKAHKDC